MTDRRPHIAVVTGDHAAADPTKRDRRYNAEDFATDAAMRQALQSLAGYRFSFWSDHAALLAGLAAARPDLVANFCDTGLFNVPTQELHLPAWLELQGIPYTGAPPAAMVLCYDKQVVRLVAEALGVPVPREAFLPADRPADAIPAPFPALIKPNTADGSVGITKDAVVHDAAEAAAYLAWLRAALPGRDALLQEYLPGPEYGVALLGNPATGLDALPALEVDFSGLPAGLAPILSYESKALPDSPYWTEIRFRRARLPAADEARLAAHARRLFGRLGLRDYARFDFRCAADGTPRLMEVNPNPAWANDGKLAFMAGFAGLAYPDMLRAILEAAFRRLETAEGAGA